MRFQIIKNHLEDGLSFRRSIGLLRRRRHLRFRRLPDRRFLKLLLPTNVYNQDPKYFLISRIREKEIEGLGLCRGVISYLIWAAWAALDRASWDSIRSASLLSAFDGPKHEHSAILFTLGSTILIEKWFFFFLLAAGDLVASMIRME